MNIQENQLYSSLSQLTRQSFLMQTEFPTLLNVFEADYEQATLPADKINTSRIIHDRKLRNCVTTALTLVVVAVGFSACL